MATEDKRIDQLDPVSVLDLTSLMAMQQGANAKKVTLQQLLDYLNRQIDTGNSVLFVSQTLTDAQKLQARTNIGAAAPGEGGGSAANAVLYTAQTLTEEQQHQARLNIRCGSVGVVGVTCKAEGSMSHAEGYDTTASGFESHAEGYRTTASGSNSHSEGQDTTASGDSSHAEGYNTRASNFYSHAEGADTIASGKCTHAEGSYTIALGYASHAEGVYTTASGSRSHAEGNFTEASGISQHVQGEYNIVDTEASSEFHRGKYAHIVGNGTADDARSNAHTLDWAGVPWFAGDRVMLGGTGMDDEAAVALMPIFVPQELTEEQKLQARTNIGAMAKGDTEVKVSSKAYLNSYKIVVTVNGVESEGPAMSLVRYDVNQTGLTEEQKAQARANIGVDAYIEQVFLGGEW